MPWQQVRPMDQRVQFLGEYLDGGQAFSRLCERYGVSRKTGYKWLGRYAEAGPAGLVERSRRPRASPGRIPEAVREQVLSLRGDPHDPRGPKKIQQLLRQRLTDQPPPSKTSIYNILKAAGHIEARRRRRRVAPTPQPFAPAHQPNDLWSVDFKGQFKLGDAQWCYPLTVMDHVSRYLLACQGLAGTAARDSRAVFERLFCDYGLPRRIRSDNGAPFASTATAGLSRLSIWWIKLGIEPERITPGKPQHNARHERMHRTLKRAAVTGAVAADLAEQQARFDRFRGEYNDARPHESLALRTPSECHHASPREMPRRLPVWDYPGHVEVRRVSDAGVVYWHNKQLYVGYVLHGEDVALEWIDERLWQVHFGPVRLGRVRDQPTGRHRDDYLTLKV